MPAEPAPAAAERKRRARETERRRSAVTLLQITECTCRYAASQLANGCPPPEARGAALEAASEMIMAAEALRRLVRLSGPDRKTLARQLHAVGLPTKRIAAQVGVCERSVRYYVAGR